MQSFLSTINDVKKIIKAKKNIAVENKKVKQNILENKKDDRQSLYLACAISPPIILRNFI